MDLHKDEASEEQRSWFKTPDFTTHDEPEPSKQVDHRSRQIANFTSEAC